MRGATLYRDQYAICCSISTHTPHAGRDRAAAVNSDSQLYISTHTPHAGRDNIIFPIVSADVISTHTPHAGRDMCLNH